MLNDSVFCFANTHTDHVSEKARTEGMKLIIDRMKDFGAGVPIVFTGDHNCRYGEVPANAMRQVLKDARDIAETPAKGPHNTFHGFGTYKDGSVVVNEHLSWGERHAFALIMFMYRMVCAFWIL